MIVISKAVYKSGVEIGNERIINFSIGILCTIILIISSYETEDIKGIIGERRTA